MPFYQTSLSSQRCPTPGSTGFAASVYIGDRRYRRSAARSKVYQRTELIRIAHHGVISICAQSTLCVGDGFHKVEKGHDDADANTN